jgi:alpha-beta hydrolase superfamily lysophospholipase
MTPPRLSLRLRIAAGIGLGVVAVAGAACIFAWREAPGWAAAGLLHPSRRPVDSAVVRDVPHDDLKFVGDRVRLTGWRFPAHGPRRATIVYLHGIADNRASAVGPARRLVARGFDVVAYDSRANGDSGGNICTYGYYEKRDLRRVLNTIDGLDPGPLGPVIVIGTSLGGAVALQAAADDPRISAVVAAEPFSDLRTIATERAPWYLPSPIVRRAFALAELQGRFEVDAVSPMNAATHITVPVLLIHGARDQETRPEHSRRIYDALAGQRKLLIVDGAAHNQSLTNDAWQTIEVWIDGVLTDGEHR